MGAVYTERQRPRSLILKSLSVGFKLKKNEKIEKRFPQLISDTD